MTQMCLLHLIGKHLIDLFFKIPILSIDPERGKVVAAERMQQPYVKEVGIWSINLH